MNQVLIYLIPILMQVESGRNSNAIGDNGKAVGCLQIHECVIKDVNRIYGKEYSIEDRRFEKRSMEICYLYLDHYGKRYEEITGEAPDHEVYCRIWNGGPNGWRKESTQKYWIKVKEAYLTGYSELKKIER